MKFKQTILWFFIFGKLAFAADTSIPSSIVLTDSICTNGTESYGLRSCAKVKTLISNNSKSALSNAIAWYYDGKLLHMSDHSSGFCVAGKVIKPVCNAAKDSVNANYLGASCGDYCDINFSGVDLKTCKKEAAWARGARAQLLLNKLDDVLAEIQAGTLSITKAEEGGTCGNYASAVKRLTKGDVSAKKLGIEAIRESFKKSYEVTKTPLNTTELEGCLKNDYTGNETEEELNDLALGKSVIGDGTKQLKTISQAFCHIAVAQRHIEHVVAKAAVCEAMVRAKIDYYKKQYDADGFIDQLNAKVITPCKAYANEEKLEFKSRFNKCYKYGIAAVPGGVFGFFKNAVTPIKNPIVTYEKHKDKGGAVYSFPDCE